jgi:hypothetical protein
MRPTIPLALTLALALHAVPSCRRREATPPAPAPPPTTAGPLPDTDPRPLTPARREALEDFARALALRINAGEFDAAARELDLTTLTHAAFSGIRWDENPKWLEFRDSLVRRLRADPAQLFAALQGSRAVFIRLHETPSGTAALIRCLLPSGAATYFDVFARFDQATATPRLANVYNHATGLDVPDSLRSILFALAPAADRSLADRLFGVAATADTALLTEFDTALRQRNPAAVAAVWPRLPASLRAQRPVFMATLQVLMLDPQAPAYLAALEEARSLYAGEAVADLLSIDLHFLKNDTAALEACLDRIEQRLGGPDAHLATLRASGRLAAGNDAGAEQVIDAALAMEPDFTNASQARLKLLITRRDFTGAVALLESLDSQFGGDVRPPPASRGPAFADFLESPPYLKWKALHPDPPEPAATAPEERDTPDAPLPAPSSAPSRF